MRDVRSRNYFEQMKGRGTRTLDHDDLRKVTPSAATAKTHYVIVDAVGVTKSVKTDSGPICASNRILLWFCRSPCGYTTRLPAVKRGLLYEDRPVGLWLLFSSYQLVALTIAEWSESHSLTLPQTADRHGEEALAA